MSDETNTKLAESILEKATDIWNSLDAYDKVEAIENLNFTFLTKEEKAYYQEVMLSEHIAREKKYENN